MHLKHLIPAVLAVALLGAACGGSGAATSSTAGDERELGEGTEFVRDPDSQDSRLGPAPRDDQPHVVGCEDAIIGSGPPDWRFQSSRAGPVAVGDRPLRQMSPYGERRPGWLVTKMMALIAGHRTVILSVPPRLRHRAFLYYGTHPGRSGKRSTSFYDYPGDSAIAFEPCRDKPRTVWPGGTRVKGRAPVHLLVTVEGDEEGAVLRLGRPMIATPR
jgi:hypothetical protein